MKYIAMQWIIAVAAIAQCGFELERAEVLVRGCLDEAFVVRAIREQGFRDSLEAIGCNVTTTTTPEGQTIWIEYGKYNWHITTDEDGWRISCTVALSSKAAAQRMLGVLSAIADRDHTQLQRRRQYSIYRAGRYRLFLMASNKWVIVAYGTPKMVMRLERDVM